MVRKSLLALVVAVFLISGVNSAHAMNVNAGGLGDLLLGSAYDVRALTATSGVGLNTTVTRPAQWENFIEISNTSNSWVAFHLRFRAASKSIEVWDHIILLSPYDVFWLDLQRGTNGGLKIYSNDTHTLQNSGLAAPYSWSYAGQPTSLLRDCGYTTGDVQESELGYIEAIGLWSIPSTSHSITSIAALSGITGLATPNVYDLLFYMWGTNAATPTDGSTILSGRTSGDRPEVYGYTRPITIANPVNYPFRDCPNALRGSIEMGDVVTGAYQTDNFIAIQDFRTANDPVGTVLHRDGYNGNDALTANNAAVPVTVGVDGGVIGFPVFLLTSGTRAYTAGGITLGVLPPDVREIAWYANPDVNTTVGPLLKDGNSDTANPLVTTLVDRNLGIAPAPETGDDLGFNSPWSLFDLEAAATANGLWGFYYNSKASDAPFNAINKTSAVFTFFTKHDHFLFGGWKTAADGSLTGLNSIWDGVTRVKSSLWPFWNGPYNYSIDSLYAAKVNADRALVAAKWAALIGAPCYAKTFIWDMDQNIEGLTPTNSPTPYSPNVLPNEVNVVDFGDLTGILATNYTAGQFNVLGWVFPDDQYAPIYAQQREIAGGTSFDLPISVIGMVIRDNYVGTGSLHRTSSSPYQFTYPVNP